MPNSNVSFHMMIGGQPVGRFVMELNGDSFPRAAENFRAIFFGERGVGRIFHLVTANTVAFFAGNGAGTRTGGELMAHGGPDRVAGPQAPAVGIWQDLEAGGGGRLLSTRLPGVDPRLRGGPETGSEHDGLLDLSEDDFSLLEVLVMKQMQMMNGQTKHKDVYKNYYSQATDALVSTFSAFEMKEADPLVLAWAVFLYLVLTLPKNDENNELMDIDHISYVCQAFEAGSLVYCLKILQCDILKEYDVHHSYLGSITSYSG